MTHPNEIHPMPAKDPNNWGWLLNVLTSIWPQLYAAGMAFVVALVCALYAGGKPFKALLEGLPDAGPCAGAQSFRAEP